VTEIERITQLYEQVLDGIPYYGQSLMKILEGVDLTTALQKPESCYRSIFEIVPHITSELEYTHKVIEGTAGAWEEGITTWPGVRQGTEAGWQLALDHLRQAHRHLTDDLRGMRDEILPQQPIQVRGPYYLMLHGTLQHTIFHSGEISLLKGM
jgi:hypothetical protein